MRRKFLLPAFFIAVALFFVVIPVLFVAYEMRKFDLSDVSYGYGDEGF